MRHSSCSRGATCPSTSFPPMKSRPSIAPTAKQGRRRWPAPRRHEHGRFDAPDFRSVPPRLSRTQSRARAWWWWTGHEARHRRLRLLAVSALGHRRLLLPVCRLRGACRRDRWRSPRTRYLRPGSGCDRNSLSSRFELLLRTGNDCRRAAQSDTHPGGACDHRTSWPRFSSARGVGIRELVRTWRRTYAERVSLGVFHPCRLSRTPRDGRAALARHHDGTVPGEGIPARHRPALSLLQHVLAFPRHHLGGDLLARLSGGNTAMTIDTERHGLEQEEDDKGGASDEHSARLATYVIGLGLAILLTAASFWVAKTDVIYGPGIPEALATLAVAQMGVHLVFFLHLTTAPDNTNNILALAFGLLIVGLIVFGSVWIMAHLNNNLMPMQQLMQMQR